MCSYFLSFLNHVLDNAEYLQNMGMELLDCGQVIV
jgi:hypothetical protein